MVITGDVDTTKAGTYKLTYTVTDSDGNTTTEEITVTVAKKTGEKVKLGVYGYDNVIYQSIDIDYYEGDNAFTVLKRVLGNRVDDSGEGETVYVNGIDGLLMGDKGHLVDGYILLIELSQMLELGSTT